MERPVQPPTVLNHWDGIPSIMLFKIQSGALLWWMFQDDEGEQLGVFVHLTDDEAQAVFHGPIYEGLLEPIRENLSDRRAVVWNFRGDGLRAAEFDIPGGFDEPKFAHLLWTAAENARVDDRAESGISRDATQAHGLSLSVRG